MPTSRKSLPEMVSHEWSHLNNVSETVATQEHLFLVSKTAGDSPVFQTPDDEIYITGGKWEYYRYNNTGLSTGGDRRLFALVHLRKGEDETTYSLASADHREALWKDRRLYMYKAICQTMGPDQKTLCGVLRMRIPRCYIGEGERMVFLIYPYQTVNATLTRGYRGVCYYKKM